MKKDVLEVMVVDSRLKPSKPSIHEDGRGETRDGGALVGSTSYFNEREGRKDPLTSQSGLRLTF